MKSARWRVFQNNPLKLNHLIKQTAPEVCETIPLKLNPPTGGSWNQPQYQTARDLQNHPVRWNLLGVGTTTAPRKVHKIRPAGCYFNAAYTCLEDSSLNIGFYKDCLNELRH